MLLLLSSHKPPIFAALYQHRNIRMLFFLRFFAETCFMQINFGIGKLHIIIRIGVSWSVSRSGSEGPENDSAARYQGHGINQDRYVFRGSRCTLLSLPYSHPSCLLKLVNDFSHKSVARGAGEPPCAPPYATIRTPTQIEVPLPPRQLPWIPKAPTTTVEWKRLDWWWECWYLSGD